VGVRESAVLGGSKHGLDHVESECQIVSSVKNTNGQNFRAFLDVRVGVALGSRNMASLSVVKDCGR